MHKIQPPLRIKKPKKNNLQHQKSKTLEKKICKGVDGACKFTVKSTINPYKVLRTKKTRFFVHDLWKSYVNTTSHKYVEKNWIATKIGAQCPHIAKGHSFSSIASVSMEQSISIYPIFSRETQNKHSFTSDEVQFLHYNWTKKSKNWWKTRG